MLVIVLLTLTLMLLVLSLVHWYYKVSHYEKYLKNIPGPISLPLAGQILTFAWNSHYLNIFTNYYKRYNGNYKLYLGVKPHLVICDTRDVEFLLKSTTILSKSYYYKFLRHNSGDGIVVSTGDKWKKHRKIVTPAFHYQRILECLQAVNKHCDCLISKLKQYPEGISFDIQPAIGHCTLDIVFEFGMGEPTSSEDNTIAKYVSYLKIITKSIRSRGVSLIASNNFFFRFTKMAQTQKRFMEELRKHWDLLIERRKTALLDSYNNREEYAGFGQQRKTLPFLDLLLEHSIHDSTFTRQHINDEVDTFMAAGYDTTTKAISFTLFALADNPDIQQKLYAEIKEILSDDPKRDITYKDVKGIKYLRMVIKESLRLYPPIPYIGRTLEEDVEWNGQMLPKGLDLIVFIYGIHHSALFYKNPEKFDPERFRDNSTNKDSYSYIPFSAGPRNCIGQKMAVLAMKAIIISILRNFELLPAVPKHELDLRAIVVLSSKNKVLLQMRPRK